MAKQKKSGSKINLTTVLNLLTAIIELITAILLFMSR